MSAKTPELKLIGCLAAFFFPPLGVVIGGGGLWAVLLNFLLFLCFWLPGFLHALYYVLKE